jgi:signal transduction histidine kinase
VVVRLIQLPDTLRLEVEDEGEGISPGDLPHVFEPFYRSQQARSRGLPGTGLGLAVAKRIATALGGRLSVESQLGAGSCFQLTLPPLPVRVVEQLTQAIA